MRLLLVGQAPSRSGKGRPAFVGGGSGSVLRNMLGVDPEKNVDAVNLLTRYPGKRGKRGKSDAFPLREARCAAARLLPLFAVRSHAFLQEFTLGSARCAVVPHPSRVNRWWNRGENRAAARRFVRGFLRLER